VSTDTLTPPAETPAETPAAPSFDLTKLDETDRALFNKTEKAIADYNRDLTTLKSLSGDVTEVADSIRQSDDPEIVSLRERTEKAKAAFEKAQAALDESAKTKAEAKVAENTDTEKVDSLKATTDKLLKRIKATQSALRVDYGDEVVTAFTKMANTKAASNGDGRGAGVPRPRNFTVSVNGQVAVLANNNKEKVSSFSAARAAINEPDITTKEVQAGWFAAHGTDPNGWVAGMTAEYDVTAKSGKVYHIVTTKNRDK
jgi:hypothetical protein